MRTLEENKLLNGWAFVYGPKGPRWPLFADIHDNFCLIFGRMCRHVRRIDAALSLTPKGESPSGSRVGPRQQIEMV